MPNYEYKCKECNATEEGYRHIDDRDNLPKCNTCGILMDRIWQATPAHFKGSGFYSTGG